MKTLVQVPEVFRHTVLYDTGSPDRGARRYRTIWIIYSTGIGDHKTVIGTSEEEGMYRPMLFSNHGLRLLNTTIDDWCRLVAGKDITHFCCTKFVELTPDVLEIIS